MALRSLRARPSRTLLTMFGIVMGVAVILAISVANATTIEALANLFGEAAGRSHLVVASTDVRGEGFAESVVRQVAAVPGVAAAVPTLQTQALLADDSASSTDTMMSFLGMASGGLTLFGIYPEEDVAARDYTMVEGQFLPDDLDVYEVVLVKDFAEEKDLKVGGDLHLLTSQGVERLKIVGLMSKEGPAQLFNGAFGIVPLGAAQRIFGRVGDLDQIDIIAEPEVSDSDGLDVLKATIQARLGDQYTVTFPAAQGERVSQMLDSYQIGLGSVSAITLFVGAFLIYNAFSMTVVERTREIGTMRTVGMTRGQVTWQILVEAALLGLLGSAFGVLLGILMSRGLIQVTELMLGQEVEGVRIPLDGLFTSTSVGVVVTLVAALIPAYQAGKISPLEALRIRGTQKEGWIVRRGWIVGLAFFGLSCLLLFGPLSFVNPDLELQLRTNALLTLFVGGTLLVPITVGAWDTLLRPVVRRVYGSEGRLGSSNIRRAKMRTTLTVAALMVGAAMILSTMGITDSFERDLQEWIEAYIGGDLYVSSSLPMRMDLGPRLEAVPGVSGAAPLRYFDVRWLTPGGGDESITFTAIDPQVHSRVTSVIFAANQGDPEELFDQLAQGDAVFLSNTLSEKYGVGQGDTMTLSTRRGEKEFDIVAIVVDYFNQGLTVHGSWDDMRRYYKLDDVSVYLVKAEQGFSLNEVRDNIDRVHGQRRRLSIESNEAIRSQALRLMGQVFAMFDVVVVIAMAVAAMGVVNTLTMNVMERTREIGMLRSLGMTRTQVAKMVLAEAALLGLIGGVFGTVFGIFVSRAAITAMTARQGYGLTFVLPRFGIVASLVIAIVIAQMAALWPARRAAGLAVIDALAYE